MRGTRIVWPEVGRAELEACDVPEPEAGEVLIRTDYTLVSPGTERAHLLGQPNTPRQFPAYPGYSNAGQVIRCGPGVQRFQAGDVVASYAPHASHVVVGEQMVAKVGRGLAPQVAAFCSLATIALQGVRKARVELGSVAAVLGMGLIGLFALQWCRLAGALETVALDVSDERLESARLLGATRTMRVDERPAGPEPDLAPTVVIDATGNPAAIVRALEICAYRGRVAVLGSPRGSAEQVDFYSTVHKKGLEIIGAHDYVRPAAESTPGYWTWADDAHVSLSFLEAGRLLTGAIPTRTYRPMEVSRLYQDLLAGEIPLAVLVNWQ